MHPLLPIYAAMSFFALMGVGMQDSRQRTMILVASWSAMTIVLLTVVFRPIRGDTWRYYMSFLRWREMELMDVWTEASNNWFFLTMNWLLGQLGESPLFLIAPVTALCIYMLHRSLRQLLNPTYAAIGILLYSVYPFFIFYVASGLKQGIAMAFLLQAYVCFQRRRQTAWLWLLIAPLFHTGALLVFPFLLLHLLTWRPSFGYRRALGVSLSLLIICTMMAITNINQTVIAPVQNFASFSSNYDIYFQDANEFNYRAGFRLDFTLFSMLPLMAAILIRRRGHGLSPQISGWWINLYTLLTCIYQLFAFAPFADRFASFGWYFSPLLLLVMLFETGLKRPLQIALLIFLPLNMLMLQFYTGKALRVDLFG